MVVDVVVDDKVVDAGWTTFDVDTTSSDDTILDVGWIDAADAAAVSADVAAAADASPDVAADVVASATAAASASASAELDSIAMELIMDVSLLDLAAASSSS